MKRAHFITAMIVFIAMPAMAQYWTTTSTYDPFRNGEKFIGLSAGTGWWFGPSEALNTSNYGIYNGYNITNVKRPPLNPMVALHYKRVLQGNTVDWGHSYYLSYNKWGGTVEGALADTTFSTKYNYTEVMLSSLLYIMVPIGDIISINGGIGLSIGTALKNNVNTTFSNGKNSESSTGVSLRDLILCRINAMLGVDYNLSDSFTVNATVLAAPIDFFGMFADHKNMRSIGGGLYVNNKLPFQLTVGFTYHL